LPPPSPPKIPLPPVFPFRWACAYGEDEFGLWQTFEVQGVRQVLRWIPPGEFWMGSPDTEAGRYGGETRHPVTLTQGFWLADTACTQALWQAVLGENPRNFKQDPSNPVERVSWNGIQEKFLPALNRLVPRLEAGLPSEAQWEYACRAGTQTPFWFGEQITPEQVNYEGNYPYVGRANGEYREKTVPVKSLPANGWGLYEMHGNVREWCEDVWGEYPSEAVVDPRGPQYGVGGRQRVLRGGSWYHNVTNCRSAFRYASEPDEHYAGIGFRLARGAD
jgi:formylglycine-generating enzyme required for sulfatase activity